MESAKVLLRLSIVACVSVAMFTAAAAQQSADTIFIGGDVVTVNDAQPIAKAVAVTDGKIVAVGSEGTVMDLRGPETEIVYMGGGTMIPGIIDPHSHFFNALAMQDQPNISYPPVGTAETPDDIVEIIKQFAEDRNIKPGEIILAYGYDENLMPKGNQLTRDHLDAAFSDNPVAVQHVSLHGAVLNSAAFQKVGIDANTVTPEGGVILRRGNGSLEPLGLIMETAWMPIFTKIPQPDEETLMRQLEGAQALYAANGITTAQEGATAKPQVDALARGAEQGRLFIDVAIFPFITEFESVLAEHPVETWRKYNNGLKFAGVKITMDGSPQGKTALFTTPYLTGGPGGEANWKGEPTFPQNAVNKMLKDLYAMALPVNVHANGDGAIDMLLEAHAQASEDTTADRRTTIIHSQFVRSDQLDKYVEYKMIPSFYTEHTFFFGDSHVANRGPEQAAYLSPMRDAIDRGLQPTNHTDFNVVPIDHMMVIETAVTRRMRNGDVLGPDQRITAYEALKAITINAARHLFEEDSKGSIEVGKRADLAILSANPLTVDPDDISSIRVKSTYKDGKMIYPTRQ